MKLPVIQKTIGAVLAVLLFPIAGQAQWFGKAPQLKTGEDVYRHVCQTCHMPDGRGAKSPAVTAPSLAGNSNLSVAAYPISVILNGKVAMPWFNGSLTDAQIAAVTNYIRTNFGNDFAEQVTAEDVKVFARPVPTPER